MILNYRQGTLKDLRNLKKLALKSWAQFEPRLTRENWQKLHRTLQDEKTYGELIEKSHSVLCVSENNIVGMAFLVPNGNPTDIYQEGWSYIRFVTVDPEYSGQGIAKKLTTMCIDTAKCNKEKVIALHTSELMDAARHI